MSEQETLHSKALSLARVPRKDIGVVRNENLLYFIGLLHHNLDGTLTGKVAQLPDADAEFTLTVVRIGVIRNDTYQTYIDEGLITTAAIPDGKDATDTAYYSEIRLSAAKSAYTAAILPAPRSGHPVELWYDVQHNGDTFLAGKFLIAGGVTS